MSGACNPNKKHYGSQLCRSLPGAVAQRIGEEFPRLGGPRIQELCAQMILDVVFNHIKPREFVGHGQALWSAISLEDPPSPRRPVQATRLVPVVLSLSTAEDVEARISGQPPIERLTRRCVRLCMEAYEQGALLSNCDIAEMLAIDERNVSSALSGHEKATGKPVPRRATLHDVGTAITHKKIICLSRWAQGKSSHEIARETYHSIEAVDRYLGMFERVRCCKTNGMDAQQTAFALACSQRLVEEYLEIQKLLEEKTPGPKEENTANISRQQNGEEK